MLANIQRVVLAVVFSAIAGAGSLAWADHGHGGGHGNWGGGGWSGGHGHVSSGHFGGYSGFNNHWGGGSRFYSGYRNYGNYGWPYYRNYNNFYRPYAYSYFAFPYLYGYYNYPYGYSYPSYYYSYPSDYYVNGGDYYGDTSPPREYVVSRPVGDIARVEIRLPDPQGTLWVQGQEIDSAGTVRKFRSPQLDPSQQYTYTVKAQWNDNGKLVTDERQVKVQANGLAVVDFNQPTQAVREARRPALPDLPPPQQRPVD
jgi:uncharacterized protein (TIGR03000 family)